MELEIALMDLVLALQNNDIEITKQCVDFLNSISDTIDPETNIWLLLDIHNPDLYKDSNESIEYLLLHLKGLINPEVARWNRKKHQLLHFNDDLYLIENFISEQLNKKTYNIDNSLFKQGLIQLIVKLDDPKKTKKFFNEILKLEIKEDI